MKKQLSPEELKQIAAHFSRGPKKPSGRKSDKSSQIKSNSLRQVTADEPVKMKPEIRLDPPNRKKQLQTISESPPDLSVDTIKTAMNQMLDALATERTD